MNLLYVRKCGWVTTDPALVPGGRDLKLGDYFGIKDGSTFLMTANGAEVVSPENMPAENVIVPASYYDVVESRVVSSPSNLDIR